MVINTSTDVPLKVNSGSYIPIYIPICLMNSNRLGQYTHIRSVCEKCAVGVNLVQKQVMAGTPGR